jgi:hypothetical protein
VLAGGLCTAQNKRTNTTNSWKFNNRQSNFVPADSWRSVPRRSTVLRFYAVMMKVIYCAGIMRKQQAMGVHGLPGGLLGTARISVRPPNRTGSLPGKLANQFIELTVRSLTVQFWPAVEPGRTVCGWRWNRATAVHRIAKR